jgi:hypothetical protein
MPNITITKKSLDEVLREVKLKVEGVTSIITPYNREQIAKAAFVIVGKEFIRQINRYAAANKQSMHHIYEWNKVGSNSARLFTLNRTSVSGGRLTISTKFLNSRSEVPVSPQLRRPGKNGKSVKGGHVFKNKADIMESGKTVHISAKNAKALAFPGKDGKIKFIPRGYYVSVRNPGGKFVKGSFTKYSKEWFRNPSNVSAALMSSGYLKKLEVEVARSLKANKTGTPNVSTAIKKVSDQYAKGIKVL